MRPVHVLPVLVSALVLAACANEPAPTAGATGLEPPVAPPTTTSSETSLPTTTTIPETTTTSTVQNEAVEIILEVANGSVVGGGRVEVPLERDVRLTVVSDVADEVHIHGYDLFFDVTPGEPAEYEFTADIPGVFEIELESSHLLLAELEVRP